MARFVENRLTEQNSGALLLAQSVTPARVPAGSVFATPAALGILTAEITPELVDEVIDLSGCREKRRLLLPARRWFTSRRVVPVQRCGQLRPAGLPGVVQPGRGRAERRLHSLRDAGLAVHGQASHYAPTAGQCRLILSWYSAAIAAGTQPVPHE